MHITPEELLAMTPEEYERRLRVEADAHYRNALLAELPGCRRMAQLGDCGPLLRLEAELARLAGTDSQTGHREQVAPTETPSSSLPPR